MNTTAKSALPTLDHIKTAEEANIRYPFNHLTLLLRDAVHIVHFNEIVMCISFDSTISELLFPDKRNLPLKREVFDDFLRESDARITENGWHVKGMVVLYRGSFGQSKMLCAKF